MEISRSFATIQRDLQQVFYAQKIPLTALTVVQFVELNYRALNKRETNTVILKTVSVSRLALLNKPTCVIRDLKKNRFPKKKLSYFLRKLAVIYS